jgi:hypothetical protein
MNDQGTLSYCVNGVKMCNSMLSLLRFSSLQSYYEPSGLLHPINLVR